MSQFQICKCGTEPGYPHRWDCPFPCFIHTGAPSDNWRDARRDKLETCPDEMNELTGVVCEVVPSRAEFCEFCPTTGPCHVCGQTEGE